MTENKKLKKSSVGAVGKVNTYFFGEPEISLHDGLWFYGSNIFTVLFGIVFFLYAF